jgi:hypothetical protein
VAVQYFGQILVATTTVRICLFLPYSGQKAHLKAYGLTVSNESSTTLSELYSVDTTTSTNMTLTDARFNQAVGYVTTLLADPISNALSGTLWIFPCAGIVLILAALRSGIWYRITGTDHYIVHGGMIGFGAALSLLGLLAIGETHPTINPNTAALLDSSSRIAPMYVVVEYYSPLVIVLGVYVIVYFGATTFMTCMHRRKSKGKGAKRTIEKGT